jgi:hypothetical protein
MWQERAAYILREAFNYPYREIGDVLRLGEHFSSNRSTAKLKASPRSVPSAGSALVSTGSGNQVPAYVSRRERVDCMT